MTLHILMVYLLCSHKDRVENMFWGFFFSFQFQMLQAKCKKTFSCTWMHLEIPRWTALEKLKVPLLLDIKMSSRNVDKQIFRLSVGRTPLQWESVLCLILFSSSTKHCTETIPVLLSTQHWSDWLGNHLWYPCDHLLLNILVTTFPQILEEQPTGPDWSLNCPYLLHQLSHLMRPHYIHPSYFI